MDSEISLLCMLATYSTNKLYLFILPAEKLTISEVTSVLFIFVLAAGYFHPCEAAPSDISK